MAWVGRGAPLLLAVAVPSGGSATSAREPGRNGKCKTALCDMWSMAACGSVTSGALGGVGCVEPPSDTVTVGPAGAVPVKVAVGSLLEFANPELMSGDPPSFTTIAP